MTSAAKLADAERSVPTIARRLLESVPMAEPWGTDKILTEYSRLNGGLSMDRSKAAWCLSHLVEAGLVTSPFQHHYKRVQARPALAAVKPTEESAAVPAPKSEPAPLAMLEAVAQRLRSRAQELIDEADRIEEAALRLVADNDGEVNARKQLEQLRAVLGGLGLGGR